MKVHLQKGESARAAKEAKQRFSYEPGVLSYIDMNVDIDRSVYEEVGGRKARAGKEAKQGFRPQASQVRGYVYMYIDR